MLQCLGGSNMHFHHAYPTKVSVSTLFSSLLVEMSGSVKGRVPSNK